MPHRPLQSIPGLFCQYPVAVAKNVSPFFKRLPSANFETKSKDTRAALEATKLDEDELVVFLYVESLYTNVPVEETI